MTSDEEAAAEALRQALPPESYKQLDEARQALLQDPLAGKPLRPGKDLRIYLHPRSGFEISYVYDSERHHVTFYRYAWTVATRALERLVFLSYSRRDDVWFDRIRALFDEQLNDLRIRVWTDRNIPPGAKWREWIAGNVDSAHAAVLLVSRHFLESDLIEELEFGVFRDRAKNAPDAFLILCVPMIRGGLLEGHHTGEQLLQYQWLCDLKRPIQKTWPWQRKRLLEEIRFKLCWALLRERRN